jgi:hypothetical protein
MEFHEYLLYLFTGVPVLFCDLAGCSRILYVRLTLRLLGRLNSHLSQRETYA